MTNFDKTYKSEGLVSFLLGLVSIFYMSPVFVPLAVMVGIIALFKKQFMWGLLGLFCAFIGFVTSPILLATLGLTAVAIHGHSFHFYNHSDYHIQRPAQDRNQKSIGI